VTKRSSRGFSTSTYPIAGARLRSYARARRFASRSAIFWWFWGPRQQSGDSNMRLVVRTVFCGGMELTNGVGLGPSPIVADGIPQPLTPPPSVLNIAPTGSVRSEFDSD
jgi:hypothetical protein